MSPLLAEILKWVRSQTKLAPEGGIEAYAVDAAMVKRVLAGPDGEAFLDLLARLSVLRPPTEPNLSGPASHDYCQRRTGENGLFAALVFYLDLADQHERTPPDERPDRAEPRPAFPFSTGSADERFSGGGGETGFDPGGHIGGR